MSARQVNASLRTNRMGFGSPPVIQSRRVCVSLVCRRWRDISHPTALWPAPRRSGTHVGHALADQVRRHGERDTQRRDVGRGEVGCLDRSGGDARGSRGVRDAVEHLRPEKTFMRRSGASEQSADELAQEALLAVWSKAGYSIPAAWAPRHGYSRSPAICASMSLRREKRAGRTIRSNHPEFHVDEGPLPDAGMAVSQVELRVRNALIHLSEDQQRVIELSFYDESACGNCADASDPARNGEVAGAQAGDEPFALAVG